MEELIAVDQSAVEKGRNVEMADLAQNGRKAAATRRKIWQINHSYHCSVVGICLNRADLRLLARKKIYRIKAGESDYEIHRALSGDGDERSAANRQLSKYLDSRHVAAIHRYARCASGEEILALWRQDCADGDVAGAYWAVLTHPTTSAEIAATVYGEGHMLSFDAFAASKKNTEAAARVQEENRKLCEEVETLREQAKTNKGARTLLQERLRREGDRIDMLSLRLEEIAALKNRLTARLSDGAADELTTLKTQASERMREIQSLRQRLEGREQKMAELERRLQASERMRIDTLARQEVVEREQAELRQELAMLEQFVAAQNKTDCDDCPDSQRESCRERGLCGKTVLYVGGRANMIPHYRHLVEKHGGAFLHHDGGLENSRQLLPKLLCGADAVLCPVDCVSHDACRSVKKMCKQYRKQFVPMRSSGLSSLVRSLDAIQ
ncbi:MAG: DUF2325 domain-containing protein [Desulfobulbaceae bacterium]|jgi:hypothetical protein|nr:DUF2325 domain-containing protein [Desulfobulbaceae bacterium]